MELLKTKRLATPEYIKALRAYILEDQKAFFSKANQATSWCDFEDFGGKSKVDRRHLCMPTEPMLIDRNFHGIHTFCICTVSANRRVTMQIPVIQVDELDYWRAGYYLLPLLPVGWEKPVDHRLVPSYDGHNQLQCRICGTGYAHKWICNGCKSPVQGFKCECGHVEQ